jgi:hypothetical protein
MAGWSQPWCTTTGCGILEATVSKGPSLFLSFFLSLSLSLSPPPPPPPSIPSSLPPSLSLDLSLSISLSRSLSLYPIFFRLIHYETHPRAHTHTHTGFWADCKPFGVRAELEKLLLQSGEECVKEEMNRYTNYSTIIMHAQNTHTVQRAI